MKNLEIELKNSIELLQKIQEEKYVNFVNSYKEYLFDYDEDQDRLEDYFFDYCYNSEGFNFGFEEFLKTKGITKSRNAKSN
jgi:hypothetical protein